MKHYILAIFQTILLALTPIVSLPFLQWYKRTFLEEGTDVFVIGAVISILWSGLFILTILRWVLALEKEFNKR